MGFLLLLGVLAAAPGSLPSPSWEEDAHAAVAEVFEARCLRCHGPEKQKGKLRFDVRDQLLRTLVPGEPDESELYRRISLPEDDLDVMPASGEVLTPEQIALVRGWIAAGAPELVFAATRRAAEALAADRELLARVAEASGARVVFLAAPGSEVAGGPLLADGSLGQGRVGAAALGALAPVAGRVLELSLAGRSLEPGALDALPTLPALERAHLERTDLDDAGLAHFLERAPALSYLNLHSTEVGPASAEALKGLARLERLVLFATGFDGAALARLAAERPGVRITGETAVHGERFPYGGPRRVLAADASKGRIALLQETALRHYDLLWEHEIRDLHDLQVLEDGNVLFQESWTRLVEVDPGSGEVVWSYDAATANRAPDDGRVEVHAFQRLPGGVTMIAESGPARIVEVDREGRLLRTVPLTVDRPDPHHDTRLVRKTPAGTYLVAHEADGVVREYDAEGTVVWSFDVPLFGREPAPGHGFEAFGDQVFSAERLASGNTLIGTGNGHSVLEVTPAGEIVWRLDQDGLEGIRLAWVTTVQELSNGHLVIGNCHAGEDQPQLVEITRDKEVVWTFRDFERFGNALSNAWVVEDRAALSFER